MKGRIACFHSIVNKKERPHLESAANLIVCFVFLLALALAAATLLGFHRHRRLFGFRCHISCFSLLKGYHHDSRIHFFFTLERGKREQVFYACPAVPIDMFVVYYGWSRHNSFFVFFFFVLDRQIQSIETPSLD